MGVNNVGEGGSSGVIYYSVLLPFAEGGVTNNYSKFPVSKKM